MENSEFLTYPNSELVADITGTRTSNLPEQLDFEHPLSFSAPSRLQSIDDFYTNLNGIYSRDSGKVVKQKTTSLTNLFSLEREPLEFINPFKEECQFHRNVCLPDAVGDMLVPTNNEVDKSSKLASTSSVADGTETSPHVVPISKLQNGLNHRPRDVLRNSEANPDSSKSEGKNIHGFTPNFFKRRDNASSGRSKRLNRLVRRDTFGIRALSLEETKVVPKPSSKGKNDPELSDDDDNDDDNDSDFSESSDTTPVNSPRLLNQRSLSDGETMVHPERQPLRRRKSVHFADTSGLELEIRIPIRHVDEFEVPPRLKEALNKLRAKPRNIPSPNNTDSHERGNYNTLLSHSSLVPNFQQPFLEPTFQGRVSQQMVCLESVSILPNSRSFTGVIRVIDLEFEKVVTVRYTTDMWRTYQDIPACYVASIADCHQDQFSFHVVDGDEVKGSNPFEMAIRYLLPLSRREFWDNNYGHNYTIACLEHIASRSDDEMMT